MEGPGVRNRRNRLSAVHGSTTNYAWDPNASVALLATESDGSGNSLRDYVYAGSSLVSEAAAGTSYTYAFDGFGNVADVIRSSSGGLKWSYTYDPWGVARTAHSSGASAPVNPMQFDGQYQDATGNYDLRARIYQPGIGAFQQADPATGDHVGYAYAGDRPTALSDPSGMLSWGHVLDWFNEHVNPGYIYLQDCFGSGASAGRCALASVGLGLAAAGIGGLATKLAGVGEVGAAAGDLAGSIRDVNVLGGTQNCVNCVIAGDATLSGSPACALNSVGPQPISILEGTFGGSFKEVAGQTEIEQLLSDAGSGARGIVYGAREDAAGHVFNAVNQGGTIRFLDPQIGGPASFEGYSGFRFLWTNVP